MDIYSEFYLLATCLGLLTAFFLQGKRKAVFLLVPDWLRRHDGSRRWFGLEHLISPDVYRIDILSIYCCRLFSIFVLHRHVFLEEITVIP